MADENTPSDSDATVVAVPPIAPVCRWEQLESTDREVWASGCGNLYYGSCQVFEYCPFCGVTMECDSDAAA